MARFFIDLDTLDIISNLDRYYVYNDDHEVLYVEKNFIYPENDKRVILKVKQKTISWQT